MKGARHFLHSPSSPSPDRYPYVASPSYHRESKHREGGCGHTHHVMFKLQHTGNTRTQSRFSEALAFLGVMDLTLMAHQFRRAPCLDFGADASSVSPRRLVFAGEGERWLIVGTIVMPSTLLSPQGHGGPVSPSREFNMKSTHILSLPPGESLQDLKKAGPLAAGPAVARRQLIDTIPPCRSVPRPARGPQASLTSACPR